MPCNCGAGRFAMLRTPMMGYLLKSFSSWVTVARFFGEALHVACVIMVCLLCCRRGVVCSW